MTKTEPYKKFGGYRDQLLEHNAPPHPALGIPYPGSRRERGATGDPAGFSSLLKRKFEWRKRVHRERNRPARRALLVCGPVFFGREGGGVRQGGSGRARGGFVPLVLLKHTDKN